MHRLVLLPLLLAPLAGCARGDGADTKIADLEARVAKLETAARPSEPARQPHTLLISWTDMPGTTSKSFPDRQSCDAAKESLLEENRKTSEALPANARLATPPHLAKPVCMAG